jgi:putative hydrolase of the HAD superfamily
VTLPGHRVIGTVLWDADGVLQRVPGGWEESMRPAIEGRVRDVDGFLVEAVSEERPALEGRVRWLDVLPGLLERWGMAEALDDVVAVWLTIEQVPGTHDLVRQVRAGGTRCCLATNQDVARADVMRQRLGYDDLLDQLFFSYELGVAKPDPAYFTRVLGRLGVDPGSVLFVDDSPRNVESARASGLAAETWSHEAGLPALEAVLAAYGVRTG